MNEEQKNIETCLPESILAEVANCPTDPQFVSLVEESFDPMQQQAVQQAGSDAYNEVVASHKPYTFTSQVAQMKSNLILLLRRLWRYPFGSGTLRSLSDMWAHYITRLQGSETYGIPSRLDQLTDLPSAPLLVADRKISGVPEAEDGMSLVHLLMSSYVSNITKLTDDNKGWVLTKGFTSLPNYTELTEIEMGCVSITDLLFHSVAPKLEKLRFPELVTVWHSRADGNTPIGIFDTLPYLTEFYLPKLESAGSGSYGSFLSNAPLLTSLSMPEFKEWLGTYRGGVAYNMAALQIMDLPKLEKVTGSYGSTFLIDCPVLWKVVVGNFTAFNYSTYGKFDGCPKIRHLESKNIVDASVNLSSWNPDSETLAHEDFLTNFRSFIVLRLANRKTTSALTLTLSANVYNAVTGASSGWASQHTLADLGITDNDLTELETELGITSATIYATWLDTYTGANGIHWNVNKAN